jgi:hypothetical protein
VELPGLYVSATEEDVGPSRGCVALWNEALPGTGLAEKVNALPPKAKRCMVAHMFNHCVRVIEQWEENSRAEGVIILLARQKRNALRRAANTFFEAECEGVRLTQAQERLRASLTASLEESLHE